ncbi:MAG TPA: CaiB/BaiF CoA-transferase family protein [Acidimicrobiia bacterium]|nr:CaiB/BaiF CoA-transferase family protein [Acidimicrobiia bacterium]
MSGGLEGDNIPDVEDVAVGPLQGIRVIEAGGVVAASFGARLLADMGAEVIKIEAPDRLDPLRYWGRARIDDQALWWPIQSRNKRLITLNLRDPAGADLLVRLCERSDVFIENFRPGTLERWNIGCDRLLEANPGLVIARISGFGQTGPYAHRPAYAAVAEAMGGIRYINGYPDLPPPRSGLSLGDSLAGMFATLGVLAALLERRSSGLGQVIDTALTESCLALMESSLVEYDMLGEVRKPSGTRLAGIAPSNIFRSRDDHWVVIAANQDQMFVRLCEVMGRPDLATDERFADHVRRGENQDEIEQIVADWVARHDIYELDHLLAAADIVAGPIYSVEDIFKDPQYQARDMLVDHHTDELGSFRAQGVVPKFSRTPGSVRWAGAWQAGADNDMVYRDLLGIDDAQLAELRAGGVI